jgi:hypothetical protein
MSMGGGVFSSGGATVMIESSTISGNTATAGMAGMAGGAGLAGMEPNSNYDGAAGKAGTGAATTVSYGGGLYATATIMHLVQDTIAQNSADFGGGIRLSSSIETQIDNSTIALNTAGTDGGGISAVLSTINAISTVIGQNMAAADGQLSGLIFATDCLIGTLSAGATVFDGGGTMSNVDPHLSTTLALNGGATEVLVPMAGSPLKGAGSNPDNLTLDQSGHARTIKGKIDIGAVEV